MEEGASTDRSSGEQSLRLSQPAGRWVLVTAALGSGMTLLDSTVVNVALPVIGSELGAGVGGLQWAINAYLLTLSSFLLVGGSLGDRLGRRLVFQVGVLWFAIASLLCGLAPSIQVLCAARALQGIGGALLTPGSLALIQATLHPDDRGRAIGIWSGSSGIAAAIGPLVGGWLVGSLGWRWVFFLNLPLSTVAWAASRRIPESVSSAEEGRLDWLGAALAVIGLGGITMALIEADASGLDAPLVLASFVVGLGAALAFLWVERRHPRPMLPMSLFRIPAFSAANLVTLCAYAGLGGMFFFFVLYLQMVAGYSPFRAGVSLLPISVVMFLLSSWVGGLSSRVGVRAPMTAGCVAAAAGMAWLSRLDSRPSYFTEILPPILVFAFGLAFVAIPVTVAVLACVGPERAGIASGVNNAIARAAGLLAVAALPLATGLAGPDFRGALSISFPRAMIGCALLFLIAAAITWFSIPSGPLGRAPADSTIGRASCPVSSPPLEPPRRLRDA